jgi:hypothetical protein
MLQREASMAKPPNLLDKDEFPGMVGWFDPAMLVDIARQAIVSALFGQYADRRLIQAALDPAESKELLRRAGLTANLVQDSDGAIWVDYVADLGDGFDSTYAIAYLLGRPQLEIEGAKAPLPRGQVLLMGGDQVYPAATRKEYKRRMRRPYAFAFPDSTAGDAQHPALLLIPGNHDWYDGLTLFLALFCTRREKKIGSWRAIQRRSYFAQQLPNNWWIWGFDSQLGEDIDQPQADYFVTIAKEMPENARIILCAPVPTWIYGETKAKNSEEREKFYRGLDYIALEIIKKNCRNARICAVLSGDTHHYSRYSAKEDGTQFITAGGGGAFLHPTHQLVDELRITWMGQDRQLLLKTAPEADHRASDTAACYPSREESVRLLSGNRAFAFTNWKFSLTLGGIYWVAAQILLMWQGGPLAQPDSFLRWSGHIAASVASSPMFVIVALGFWGALFQYADAKTAPGKALLGAVHAIPHLLLVLALTSFLIPLNAILFGAQPGGIPSFLITLVEFLGIGGFVGASIWGAYLSKVCREVALHTNDAFSAMRLDSFRHFLRLRITNETLTIYPIGLDAAPRRKDWSINPQGGQSQNEPLVVPKSALQPRLIENPIVIPAR